MNGLLISALLFIGLPSVLLVVLKANAGVMFFAACAGIVLLSSLDPTVVTTAGALIPFEGEAYIRLVVPMLSIVFAAMMFKGGVMKKSQMVFQLFLSFLIGAMLWLVLPAATGVSWLVNNTNNSTWQDINEFRTLVVALGFGLSLLVVLLNKPKHGRHAKHTKH